MQAIVRPYFRHTIDEIENAAQFATQEGALPVLLNELRFRDGRRARKLYARLMGGTNVGVSDPEPARTPDISIAAPTEPVSEQKPLAKGGQPAKAKRSPTGSAEPHKPGPVMRAAMAAKAAFGAANKWERELLKRQAADPAFKARQDKLRAQCAADNERFWAEMPKRVAEAKRARDAKNRADGEFIAELNERHSAQKVAA